MNRKWSEADMRKAAMYYFAKPNSKWVAKKTGIPQQTISYWARKSDEFRSYVQDIRAKHQSRLDAHITHLIDAAMKELHDRIEKGDYKYDAKLMDTVRVPVSAKDLVHVFREIYDRRAMLRGEPTHRSENKSTTKDIEQLLAEKMAHMSPQKNPRGTELVREHGNLPEHMRSKKPQVPADLKQKVH